MLLFCDGCDHYNQTQSYNKWDLGGSMLWANNVGRFGQGGLYGDAFGIARTQSKSIPVGNNFVIGFAFKCTNAFPSSDTDIVNLFDGGSNQCSIRLASNGQLAVYGNGGKQGSNSTNNITLGAWNFIEWKIFIAASTGTNQCLVNVNNVNWLNLVAANTQTTGNTSANVLRIGRPFGGDSAGEYYDDIYICNNQGTYNNDLLGDCRIETLYPNAAGSHTTFGLNGAASNYLAVNEHPADDDVSYVSSDIPGNIDSYGFTAPGGTVTTVFAIQAVMRARKDNAGVRTFARSVRLGGTDFIGSAFSLGTDYNFFRDIMETNPNTSAPWTAGTVAALEGGVKVVS